MKILKLKYRSFCFKPFVNIEAGLDEKTSASKLAHEKVHYERQGYFPIGWTLKYFRDKEFRLAEETPAFKAEIEKLKELGLTPNVKTFARAMSTEYWGMVSYKKAMELLNG